MLIKAAIGESISCFDGEDMIDKAYTGLLACIGLLKPGENDEIGYEELTGAHNGRRGSKVDLDHYFSPLIDGVYIPGSRRNYWHGFVDPADHPLPEHGCVYVVPTHRDVYFETLSFKMLKNAPKKVAFRCKKPAFFYKTHRTFFRHGGVPAINKGYFAVDCDGQIYQGTARAKYSGSNYCVYDLVKLDAQTLSFYSAGAISLIADRKHLWNIQTKEDTHIDGFPAKMNFGVEEDIVKSLLFAREEPLTDRGRKRPILHWVRSHKRRIENKIEIDIEKHLRGIDGFRMGNLDFAITNPQKPIQKRR